MKITIVAWGVRRFVWKNQIGRLKSQLLEMQETIYRGVDIFREHKKFPSQMHREIIVYLLKIMECLVGIFTLGLISVNISTEVALSDWFITGKPFDFRCFRR